MRFDFPPSFRMLLAPCTNAAWTFWKYFSKIHILCQRFHGLLELAAWPFGHVTPLVRRFAPQKPILDGLFPHAKCNVVTDNVTLSDETFFFFFFDRAAAGRKL